MRNILPVHMFECVEIVYDLLAEMRLRQRSIPYKDQNLPEDDDVCMAKDIYGEVSDDVINDVDGWYKK